MPIFRPYRFIASFPAALGLAAALVAVLATCETPDGPSSITQNRGSGTGLQDGRPPHSPAANGDGGARRPGESPPPGGSVLTPGEDPLAPGAPQIRPAERDLTRIALLLPLSGADAAVGQDLLDGAQLALFETRSDRIALMPFDTLGTSAGAALAAERAVAAGAQLIIGPLRAGAVDAVAPVARKAGVSVLAFSNRVGVAGNGVFILGHVPDLQVDEIVDYALGQGLIRFAVIAPQGGYGEAVVTALRRAASRRGASVVRVATYDPTATDFSEQVKRIANYDARRAALAARRRALEAVGDEPSRRALKQLEGRDTLGEIPFDAILIPAVSEQNLRTIAALLAYYDVDQPVVRYLGLQIWDEFDALKRETALEGAWYVAPPESGRDAFQARFEQIYDRAPQRLASLAYDATALAALLAAQEGGPDYSPAALATAQGFYGVEGLFRLRPEGVSERGLAIHEIAKGEIRTRRDAPPAFDMGTN